MNPTHSARPPFLRYPVAPATWHTRVPSRPSTNPLEHQEVDLLAAAKASFNVALGRMTFLTVSGLA